MAIKLKLTSALHQEGVKLLVYGQAGAGKTTLIRTLPTPVVLSAEGGLLSLHGDDIPYIEIASLGDLEEAYAWCKDSADAKHFETVCLDSLSEVAEVVLAHELKANRDGRAAYGELNTTMSSMIRAFRDLPGKNVYVTAKLERSQDEQGRLLYNPSMPGKSLTSALPYFFDEVLALRVETDPEGNSHRALLCQPDGLWTAKDRSGRLNQWEQPDLGEIIRLIRGGDRHE